MTDGVDGSDDDLVPILSRVLPAGWDRGLHGRDQAAFNQEVRSAWLVVYYRALAGVGDPRAAEELAQEVFCRVLARLGSWPDGQALGRAYLATAARNLLADQWRRRDLVRRADSAYAGDPSSAPAPADEQVLGELERQELLHALAQLPLVQRQVLRLRVFEGLSAEEAGAVLDRSAAAVRQIQHRALVTLRRALAPGGDGPEGGLR